MRKAGSSHRSGSRPSPMVTAFVPEAGAVPFPGYKLIRLRGRGGFATVWEAEDPDSERIAMKFMSSANGNLTVTARELRSLQSIQSLVHPNLLKIRQVWSIPGTIVIAMDLADASILDLHELYIEEFRRLIEPEKIGHYLFQVAQALDFLNARQHRLEGRLVGLQHGDIKPNNILLIADQAKLADYGLATPTSGPMSPCPRHGTAEYCAPEVFQGFLSEKSDQFSLAVTYCVLRTGLFPYPPPPANRDQLRNFIRPDPNLSALPAAESAILLRALSPIPHNRYQTCIDLIQAILTVQGLKVTREDGNGAMRVGSIAGEAGELVKSKHFKGT